MNCNSVVGRERYCHREEGAPIRNFQRGGDAAWAHPCSAALAGQRGRPGAPRLAQKELQLYDVNPRSSCIAASNILKNTDYHYILIFFRII